MNAQLQTQETPAKAATYQDVLDAPAHMVAEIVAGELYAHPRPANLHGLASSVMARRIGSPFDDGVGGPGGWWIVFEPELHLGGDILVPDLAGWRRDKMPKFAVGAFFEIAPDWVCEVLSPSTRQLDQRGKRAAYAREVVSHLWFVDPDARTLEAFALRDDQWVLLASLAEADPVSVEPFEAITFNLGDLWP